jgi:PLP dependent protein
MPSESSQFDSVRARIIRACERAGRDPSTVQLVAVSKGQPPERVEEVAAGGQLVFGENKVQEARAKIPLCGGRLQWHMIGHLQTNKCRDAVEWFQMIESVDSLRVAQEIDRWAARADKVMPILAEINLAGEASKYGYAPEQALAELESISRLPRLELRGLMTMAPWTPDPERARAVFRGLREFRGRCEEKLGAPLPHLSMGMSGDFEVAIEEGATLVRIGTAIFGHRS